MKHEEQLNRYFEHGMSGSEEQNFLISVAASDELRIAFRSQLELIKAVRSDKDALHSGRDGEPVARVRDRTLAALGLSATAAAPFLNGDHGHALSGQPVVANMDGIPIGASWLRRFIGTPSISLVAGLALGVVSTLGVEHFVSPSTSASGDNVHTVAPVIPASPAVQNPGTAAAVSVPSNGEPISSGNGLQSGNSHASGTHHTEAAAAQPRSQTVVGNPAPQNGTVPTINTSGTGTMRSHMKINKPADSGTRN